MASLVAHARRSPVAVTQSCLRVLHHRVLSRHLTTRLTHDVSPKTTPYSIEGAVEEYACQRPFRTTIRSMMQLGLRLDEHKLTESARRLRHELSVRLARRIRDMNQLPFIAGCNPHIQVVYKCYVDAFEAFKNFPEIRTLADERGFVDVLRHCLAMHKDVIPTLALAVRDIAEHVPRRELNDFLEKMIRTRISRRVLAEHHLALHNAFHSGCASHIGRIGIVDEHCSPARVVWGAAQQVQQLCDRAYGAHPEVKIEGHIGATFSYIPSHIEYMAIEVLKNSMRAVMEKHALASAPPPIVVTVCKGGTEITIRVSDQGGSMDAETLDYLWSYVPSPSRLSHHAAAASGGAHGYSPVPPIARQLVSAEDSGRMPSTGFGMPMTRAYAQFLGGSLQVQNLSGYGVDCYVRVKHISDTEESHEI
eukprot:Opistho-1_new@2664